MKCKQGIDFDKSTTTVKEEGNNTLHQTKLSIIFSFDYSITSVKYGKLPAMCICVKCVCICEFDV